MSRILTLAVACLLLVSASADAAMILTVDRASDTQVTISFSGTYSLPTPSARGGRMFLPLSWTGTGGACVIGANTVTSSQPGLINGATLDTASNWTATGVPGVTGYAKTICRQPSQGYARVTGERQGQAGWPSPSEVELKHTWRRGRIHQFLWQRSRAVSQREQGTRR
jgi:hypothetical protein